MGSIGLMPKEKSQVISTHHYFLHPHYQLNKPKPAQLFAGLEMFACVLAHPLWCFKLVLCLASGPL